MNRKYIKPLIINTKSLLFNTYKVVRENKCEIAKQHTVYARCNSLLRKNLEMSKKGGDVVCPEIDKSYIRMRVECSGIFDRSSGCYKFVFFSDHGSNSEFLKN